MEKPTLPTNPIFPYEVEYKVQWPLSLPQQQAHKTGKVGISFRDGCPSAEYETSNGIRYWLRLDGEIDRE